MADKKISALTASTTPLAGTEVLPIVQSGSTVKVSVANLTAGRATSSLKQSVSSFTPDGGSFVHEASAASVTSRYWRTANDVSAWADWALQQSTDNTGAAYTTRFYFDAAGNPTVSTGNLVIGTAGKGIDFSATANLPGMTSELLTDYEEGVISIGATCDSGTITLSANTLYYTKVGRVIHVSGQLVVGSVSSPTGNVYFGLPAAAGINSAVTLYLSGTNTIAGAIPQGIINAGQSIFYVQTLDQATGNISGAATIFKAGTTMHFSASYMV